jgi:hypothetical protein
MSDACDFCSLDEANEIWGCRGTGTPITGTVFKGQVYVPLLLENENGMAPDND